jgi:Fe-S-cluster containining protein
MNKWSEQFNVKYPKCNQCAQCCKCASPSTPTFELIERAKKGDSFAMDFLSIFEPYKDIDEAGKSNPDIIERSLKICEKDNSKVNKENIVFYKCKYISDDNKCLIYEDRPRLCREYPDIPFLIFAKGCAYENWSKECKEKYNALQGELAKAKELKKEIENLKIQQKILGKLDLLNKTNNPDYNFMILCDKFSIISPVKSWLNKP